MSVVLKHQYCEGLSSQANYSYLLIYTLSLWLIKYMLLVQLLISNQYKGSHIDIQTVDKEIILLITLNSDICEVSQRKSGSASIPYEARSCQFT